MYLLIQGLLSRGSLPLPDSVQQRDAVRLQAPRDSFEKRPIVTDTNMLEHADRDDTIKRAMHGAIVEQLERNTVLQSFGGGARRRFLKLLGRQRDAGHARAVVPCQRQREPAPAASDIQHREIRTIETELGGDVPLLRDLRFFQRFVAAPEVGARVLPVAIQEQAVQPSVQVVVVRDVAPCAAGAVQLVEASPRQSHGRRSSQDRMAARRSRNSGG